MKHDRELCHTPEIGVALEDSLATVIHTLAEPDPCRHSKDNSRGIGR